jgi:metallo-beta-lactamase family protein
VIVPAFAVGRTQELVYILHRMTHNGEIPRVPVFVDSPLAVTASGIFQQHPEYFDEETQSFIANGTHPALSYAQLSYVQSADESKAINKRAGPLIIISASGMVENGRILHHLRNNIEDARNTICLVSWQAPNTLGRRLQEQERHVRIFGEEFYRRAEVVSIDGLSAHAGQDALIHYARSASQARQIILVHGEPPAEAGFRQKLMEAGAPPTIYPAQGDILQI